MRTLFTLGIILATTALVGCTKSYDYEYHANTYVPAKQQSMKIGVTKLEDKRTWAQGGSEKAESFFMSAGMWKFGLSENNVDYTPVGKIISDILVEELKNAGMQAQSVQQAKGVSIQQTASANRVDYVLTGDVQAFEVMNEPGWVTIDSRRQVNINLSLYNANGQLVDGPSNFSNNINANEGMGVMHSTNVDKLFNETLKPVMKRVVERVQSRVAGMNSLKVNVAINGAVYSKVYTLSSL